MKNLNLTAEKLLLPLKLKKDRKEYFNYYNNLPEIKEKRKLSRLMKKNKKTESENEVNSKYYGAESIKILMSLKEYTELNSEKRKKWLNFIWTFKDLNEKGFHDIMQIMKICEEAESLISDYWETAKNEISKGKSWNSLEQEQKDRLIKYWGQEKVRKENNLAESLKKQEQGGKKYETEIEMAKFHEERGKIKCECWQCEKRKQVNKEVKAKQKKLLSELNRKKIEEKSWSDCADCGEYKKVEADSGLCKKCSAEEEEYE